MPYFEMGSLYRALHRHESFLTWKVKLQLAMDVCRGLDALHSRMGVVHRDVKAENILLKMEAEGDVTRIKGYVCDFGVSAPRQVACHENNFLGTIVFAAPELFHQPKYTYQSPVNGVKVPAGPGRIFVSFLLPLSASCSRGSDYAIVHLRCATDALPISFILVLCPVSFSCRCVTHSSPSPLPLFSLTRLQRICALRVVHRVSQFSCFALQIAR